MIAGWAVAVIRQRVISIDSIGSNHSIGSIVDSRRGRFHAAEIAGSVVQTCIGRQTEKTVQIAAVNGVIESADAVAAIADVIAAKVIEATPAICVHIVETTPTIGTEASRSIAFESTSFKATATITATSETTTAKSAAAEPAAAKSTGKDAAGRC
jgi:hypothetical protein